MVVAVLAVATTINIKVITKAKVGKYVTPTKVVFGRNIGSESVMETARFSDPDRVCAMLFPNSSVGASPAIPYVLIPKEVK